MAWSTDALPALLCVAALAAPVAAEPTAEEWLVEQIERTWELSPTGSVRVDNPHGNLAVRTHSRQGVYLLANTQRHRDDPRGLDLVVEAAAEGLRVTIGFADVAIDEEPEDWRLRRSDVTVFVPAPATTRFSTRDGTLEVRGTHGVTEVETRTGALRLRVHGPIVASTEHGDVLAQFLSTAWEREVRIASRTGKIRVEIPDGGRAEVTLTTRGEVTSDYSTTIERVDGGLLKRARASVGQGGPTMVLESHQGPIQLIQSLVPASDDGGS
jgi:hypothetical protein